MGLSKVEIAELLVVELMDRCPDDSVAVIKSKIIVLYDYV